MCFPAEATSAIPNAANSPAIVSVLMCERDIVANPRLVAICELARRQQTRVKESYMATEPALVVSVGKVLQ